MAPKRGQSIEHTDEHNDFINTVAEYHKKRGTTFDREPKVGLRHIDLLKLYTRVTEEGGYDLCSDTKAKPLMWRKLAEEFVGKNQYTAAQAFQIKNVYYKNLCAYEISIFWQKEPPPKEILEEVTAKGGNVMTRTMENFVRPMTREQENLQNGDASDGSPEQNTPKDEKPEMGDDPGSMSGRSSRGLRQQPPQRVLFQPDLTSGRQTRGQTQPAPHASPTPGAGINGVVNASSLSHGASSTLASYEPSQIYPLSLKPVITPANNPEYYRNERKRKLEASAGPLARKYRNIMLPGTGFIGPNIYVRAQLALQSGIPDEEQYALHHLVKISHERGDKYRFDQFPGLAEVLIKKVFQISELFYDIEWDVVYDDDPSEGDDETLNGLLGTPDILQKLKSRIPLVSGDSILDERFLSKLGRITEAGLVLRNMSIQDENAMYLSRLPLLHDLLAAVLFLPQHHSVTELRHYMLEVAEQSLRFIDVNSQDPVYQLLLLHADSSDRGASASAFRTISRINMADSAPKRLDHVPLSVLQRALDCLLVEDEELRSACLDFLMQYTSFADNVEHLLTSVDVESLAQQLSRLLLFSARESREVRASIPQGAEDGIPPVARLSRGLVEGLLKLEEPERSSEWLRMCFLPDPNAEMTQISLWQAYQGTFGPFHSTHPQMIAGDFIKNVSSTFQGATAQVAETNKYVIRGIKSRRVPVDTGMLAGSRATDKGKELCRCDWKMTVSVDGSRDPVTGQMSAATTREVECAEWFRSGTDMLKHILRNHLRIPTKSSTTPEDSEKMEVDSIPPRPSSASTNGATNGNQSSPAQGALDFEAADKTVYRCRWAECGRTSAEFDKGNGSRTILFARHIETHLPVNEPNQSKHNVKPGSQSLQLTGDIFRMNTLEDESGDAAGLPLRAALVLRNIARFLPKSLGKTGGVEAAEAASKQDPPEAWVSRIFDDDVRERLFFAMAHNRVIKDYVGSVFSEIRRSAG